VLSLAIIVLLVMLARVTGRVMSKPRGRDMLPLMEQEFASFSLPAEARLLHRAPSFSKMTNALVEASYVYELGYEPLRAHYDQEARRLGWSDCGEKPTYDWFRDLGGRSRSYCKGMLRATLQYAGVNARYGWDYDFAVSWSSD